MPRRTQPFIPGAYYHFYNRGNNRQAIFFEADNYLYFLRGVKKHLLSVLEVAAYCLMPTHYHLLGRVKTKTSEVLKTSEVSAGQISEVLKTSEILAGDSSQTSEVLETSEVSERVSLAMKNLGISYTKAINKRFGRVGALFQGQFQARHVADERHLKHLCLYIHGNPVKDGLVAAPEAWPYSNYLEWLGLREGTLVDKAFIGERFITADHYRAELAQYLRTRLVDEALREYLRGLEA
jgi:REP element-mobilizing transposase RayT